MHGKTINLDTKLKLANLPKLNPNTVYGSNITKTYKIDDPENLQKRAESSGQGSQMATPVKKIKASPFSHQDLNTPNESISKLKLPKLNKERTAFATPTNKEEANETEVFLNKLISYYSRELRMDRDIVIEVIKNIPGDRITSEEIELELNKRKSLDQPLQEKSKAPIAKKHKTKVEPGLIR